MLAPPFPAPAIAAARAAVKAHLRIAGDHEDTLIDTQAASALALCEAFTGRALIVRDWQQTLPVSARWQALNIGGVTAIDGVTGLSADGDTIAFPPDAFAVDLDADGVGWVRVIAPGAAGRVAVTCTAGMAEDWDALPAPIMQGIVLLIAHLFEARSGATPPAGRRRYWVR